LAFGRVGEMLAQQPKAKGGPMAPPLSEHTLYWLAL
jgi:hypothetical protein